MQYNGMMDHPYSSQPKKKQSQFRPGGWLMRLLGWMVTLALLIALPFIALIRGAVWVYIQYELPSFFALSVGMAGALLLLSLYLTLAYGLLLGWKSLSWKSLKIKLLISMLAIVGYCSYTLLYFSAQQAKNQSVMEDFQELHPLLRVGIGTIVLIDPSMVVTDLARSPSDYKKMGLKTLNNSLHYPQADGYVHAMDLRTNDRQEWRNQLLELYFWMMGFNTLRHVGTADHLHISLSPHNHPTAI